MPQPFLSKAMFPALTGLVVAYVTATVLLADESLVNAAFRSWVHSGLMAAAAAVVLASAWRAHRERAAWWSMAVALVAYAAGEIAWRALYAGSSDPPFPSWADAGWLTTYPAFYVGTMLLLRARLAALSASAWLDGVIGAVVAVAAGVGLYLVPVLRATDGDAVAVAVTMAYPLGDVLLVALMVAVLALSGGRLSPAWALLVLGQVAIAVGDVFYALGTAHGTYVEGRWPDTLWPIGVLLIAYASRLPAPARPVAGLEGWRAFAVPAGLGAAAVAIEPVGALMGSPPGVRVLGELAVALVVIRTLLTVRENLGLVARTRIQAFTDDLTGMPNRRRLLEDLDRAMTEPTRPRSLILLDLDGFKAYNDSFGHGAGDELLARLGRALKSVTAGRGKAYRLGGDEFCLLADAGLDREGDEGLLADARAALSQAGEGFRITASAGTVLLPVEAADVSAALKLADERMYDGKAHARASAERRECDVTVVPLVGRGPASEIASCAWTVALDLGLSAAEAEDVGLATERHDAGKATVGDEPAGEEIPLRARIVAVCDAFVAMTSEPAWRPPDGPEAALVELRRRAVAGHFDPGVVDAFCAAVERRPSVAA